MHILDYNEKINTAMVQMMPGDYEQDRINISSALGAGHGERVGCAGNVDNVKARIQQVEAKKKLVQSGAEKTSLKAGFNTHSIELPNGCVINVQENGEVFLQEANAAPKKLRNKDSVQCLLVK
jgi:hypothetical protein|tara:strand:- start:352 stop:720 length:369 start_codon:yes stop_codon:yes gene_type:complete